ncbi:hypothetical protein C8F01DRAFT_746793 [Mycena amicta]|nr:hypothetical protein C8F01DRAFT_746793 [Mycena amicta]
MRITCCQCALEYLGDCDRDRHSYYITWFFTVMSTPPAGHPTATPVYRQAQKALHDARQAERDAHDLVTAAEDTSALAAANTALGDARQAVLVTTNDVRQADLARSAALATANAILLPQVQELARNSGLPGLLAEHRDQLLAHLHQPIFAPAADLAERIGFTAHSLTDLRSVWRTHQGRSQGTRLANSEEITCLAVSTTFLDAANIMQDLSDEDFEMVYGFWKIRRRVASPAPATTSSLSTAFAQLQIY